MRDSGAGSGGAPVLPSLLDKDEIARLYEREHKRVRQLETIGQVSRQVAATLDLNELFDRVVRLIRANFGYYHVGIYTAERQDQVVTFQASASAGGQNVRFEVAWGQGLIGWVVAHAEPVLVNDVQGEARYRPIDALEETRAELAVPLLLEDELVGVLDVQSDHADAFGPDDLYILETLGTQIAIAIHEARLYEAEQQQAWLATALLQVADAMSQVPDMDAVLTTIVRLTPILAGVDRCAILLWDGPGEAFVPAQTFGLAPELREAFEAMVFPRGRFPALDLVSLDKNPLLVGVQEPELLPPSLSETFHIQEMLILPLLAQGELLGVMLVDYAGQARHFGERIPSLLGGIANQAAMVLQTARLVQAQQEEAYVSMALLQVAEAVNQSTDLEATLATVVRITPILVGVGACAILLREDRDGGGGAFVPGQQYGLKGQDQERFLSLRLASDDPVVAALLRGQNLVLVQDVDPGSELASVLGGGAVMALPLATKGEVLGLMAVDYAGPAQRFTQRWMNILSGIAGQAAISVENSRLLAEAAERERIKQELDVARRIQTSFLPECCPEIEGWELASIWRSARQVGGDFYDLIPLQDEYAAAHPGRVRVGLVIADVADKGVPAALFMALSRTLVRTMAIDGRPPAAALARANDLIVADARSDLFVTLFYAIVDSTSGDVFYANAGHLPALVLRAASGEVEELPARGMALGVMAGVDFDQRWAHLDPGDVLVLYTDGVTEAMDARQQMFGRERLVGVVRAHCGSSAGALSLAIDQAVVEFQGKMPQSDDMTLLIARRSP